MILKMIPTSIVASKKDHFAKNTKGVIKKEEQAPSSSLQGWRLLLARLAMNSLVPGIEKLN